ncbi:MAG: hypothetical protein ACPGCP_01235 [Candidatus Nanopelagicales bacterium]
MNPQEIARLVREVMVESADPEVADAYRAEISRKADEDAILDLVRRRRHVRGD